MRACIQTETGISQIRGREVHCSLHAMVDVLGRDRPNGAKGVVGWGDVT